MSLLHLLLEPTGRLDLAGRVPHVEHCRHATTGIQVVHGQLVRAGRIERYPASVVAVPRPVASRAVGRSLGEPVVSQVRVSAAVEASVCAVVHLGHVDAAGGEPSGLEPKSGASILSAFADYLNGQTVTAALVAGCGQTVDRRVRCRSGAVVDLIGDGSERVGGDGQLRVECLGCGRCRRCRSRSVRHCGGVAAVGCRTWKRSAASCQTYCHYRRYCDVSYLEHVFLIPGRWNWAGGLET